MSASVEPPAGVAGFPRFALQPAMT